MNTGKRKRPPHPLAPVTTKFFPFLEGGWRRALVGVALLVGFLGAAFAAWNEWGRQILQSEEYVVLPENIVVTPPPAWVKADVKADVVRDCGLTRLPLLDKQLTIKVAQAFGTHHWVERVKRVSKHDHPARLIVELSYRQPVAMVEVTVKGQPGLLPVDAAGVLLPPADFTLEQTHDYLRISAPDATAPLVVGTAWADPRVRGGAAVAAALQETWKPLGLYRVAGQRVPPTGQQPKSADEWSFDVFTRQGTRIIWGSAPQSDSPSERLAAQKKLARLQNYVQANGALDSGKPSTEIDLRSQDTEPRTATVPGRPRR